MTPKQALDDLLDEVDELCDWLEYEFKCDPAVLDNIKKLNAARIRYRVAIRRERHPAKAKP